MLRTFCTKGDLEHERDPGEEPRSETLRERTPIYVSGSSPALS